MTARPVSSTAAPPVTMREAAPARPSAPRALLLTLRPEQWTKNLLVFAGVASHQPPELRQNPVVVFETEKGAIEMEVDSLHAPVTAANFLKYIDAKFFDGGTVNRSVRPDNTVRHDVEIQVIQFQIDSARRPEHGETCCRGS